MKFYQDKRVLLVDDQRTVTSLLSALLSKFGFEVVVAHDGDDAMDKIGAHAFDLILSDINMKPMGGFALTRKLRASERHRTTPIILMTGSRNPVMVVAAKRVGASDVLAKPFSPSMLSERLERLPAFRRAA